ncbi:SoxR reducing system RseC family protein [Bowmanella pacifica]|uniref:Sigma-E factor regulatory protein RseC n=1 Tax=Bowmanella pacifica TaxID=502051 RepID=A0A918DND7_9ALTE|nr:SoxR reducing system RseC family protein [Bowmanella pacifica]GGO73776.1 sigma-E factor regulatory protein RseC [Bowmanella pacifica]
MIEELGVIKAVDQDHIWVETQIKTTCGGCSVNQDCGTGAVARGLSPKSQLLIFRCTKPATIGQQVKLGIPEEDLLGASALMYLLPLLVLMASVLLGSAFLPAVGLQHELWSVLLAAIFTALSFWQIKRYLQSAKRSQYQPRLLELLPYHGQTLDVVEVTDH